VIEEWRSGIVRASVGAGSLVVVSIALAASMTNCGSPRPDLPNVLVIAIDSLRQDRVGAYGSGAGLTPFLDSLATRGVLYERAYAPSSWTVPSVASLFLGQHPSQHGVVTFYSAIPKSAVTLAGALREHGYTTGGFSTNMAVSVRASFDHGFDHYAVVGNPSLSNLKPDGKLLNRAVLSWLDETRSSVPHFVYMHYMDPHAPYHVRPGLTPPRVGRVGRSDRVLSQHVARAGHEENAAERARIWTFTPAESQRVEELYDGEVLYTDGVLQDLFRELQASSFLSNALVVITSDHGEEFGEHELYYHAGSLYQELIHVPLIMLWPGRGIGRRISAPVQLAGLAAAIFEELGLERPPSFSVAPLPLEEPAGVAPLAYSELVEHLQIKVRLHDHALMSAEQKLMVGSDGRAIAFDLSEDPRERRAGDPESVPGIDRALEQLRLELQSSGPIPDAVVLDGETREQLEALGYVTGDEPEAK